MLDWSFTTGSSIELSGLKEGSLYLIGVSSRLDCTVLLDPSWLTFIYLILFGNSGPPNVCLFFSRYSQIISIKGLSERFGIFIKICIISVADFTNTIIKLYK